MWLGHFVTKFLCRMSRIILLSHIFSTPSLMGEGAKKLGKPRRTTAPEYNRHMLSMVMSWRRQPFRIPPSLAFAILSRQYIHSRLGPIRYRSFVSWSSWIKSWQSNPVGISVFTLGPQALCWFTILGARETWTNRRTLEESVGKLKVRWFQPLHGADTCLIGFPAHWYPEYAEYTFVKWYPP